MNNLDLDMINTILGTTEQFDPPDDDVKVLANVPSTVYENAVDDSESPDEETSNISASDLSNDEDDLILQADQLDDQTSPYAQVKESLKEKIRTRRESEGADELKNLFEVPKKYKLTLEEERKNEARKQRNRLSANKSRLKRMAREKLLEEEAERLEVEHQALEREIASITKFKNILMEFFNVHLQNCKHSSQANGQNVNTLSTEKTIGSRVKPHEISHTDLPADISNLFDFKLPKSNGVKRTIKRSLPLDTDVVDKRVKLEQSLNYPKEQETLPTITLSSIDASFRTSTSFQTPTSNHSASQDTAASYQNTGNQLNIMHILEPTTVSTNYSQMPAVGDTRHSFTEVSSAPGYTNSNGVTSTSGLELTTGSFDETFNNYDELKSLSHDEFIQTILCGSNVPKPNCDVKSESMSHRPLTSNDVNGMNRSQSVLTDRTMDSSTINSQDNKTTTEKEKIEQIKNYLLYGTNIL